MARRFILEVQQAGQVAPASPAVQPTSWGQMTWAQKFEAVSFLIAFGLIFLTLSVGVAIFGSPA
jgi:hypothetical protein